MATSNPTSTVMDHIRDLTMTLHDRIGEPSRASNYQITALWSPGRSVELQESGSVTYASNSPFDAAIARLSGFTVPSSIFSQKLADAGLPGGSLLTPDEIEPAVSATPGEESRWSSTLINSALSEFYNRNSVFDRLRDIGIRVVFVSDNGFNWGDTQGSPNKMISVNPSGPLERLKRIDAAAAERIAKLSRLEQDWDGFGGEPITQEAMNAAAGLLAIIHSLTSGKLRSPFIAPLPEGGLELEWELNASVELALIVPSWGKDIKFLLDVPTNSGDVEESEGFLPRDASLSELLAGRV